MILIWVTLLLLHHGYTLVPVITVQLGEPATLTCNLPDEWVGIKSLHWYKQDVGDSLKLITTIRKNTNPSYGPGFSASRLKPAYHGKMTNLTILMTIKEDEGMYHCAVIDWTENTWSGTYMSIRANNEMTSGYTVVQQPAVSNPVYSGNPVTLQCSLLSGSDTKACSGGLSVFWFRSRNSQPDIIYLDGHRRDECKKTSDSQKRCVYGFSKNISSSDPGTYYCAVATCGQILFGKGVPLSNNNKFLDLQDSSLWTQNATAILLLCTVLVLCLIVIAILICFISENKCVHCKAVPKLQNDSRYFRGLQGGKYGRIYSAAIFTAIRTDSRAITEVEKTKGIHAAV